MGKGMDVFIDQMRSLYDEWDIRVMVLLSLLLQVLLQLLGNRRKFSSSTWVRIIVWCSYISADSIVVMALGIMSSKLGRIGDLGSLDLKTRLHAFWAPCLLLLLGGPDSITAYSVEDNQLWLRHFVVLVVQTSVTGYICFLAWNNADYLSFLSLLLLVAAVIKYGERVWVLWQVSFDNLRNTPYLSEWRLEQLFEGELTRGYALFEKFKRVFLYQKLRFQDRQMSRELFQGLTSVQGAFETIGIELGFMYDLLHTKAVAMFTPRGLYRRLITSAISCVVLAVFSFWFVEKRKKTIHCPGIDVAVTFVLLATIISLEIYYWVFLIFSSDWAHVVWLRESGSSSSSCSKFWNHNNVVSINSLLRICKQPRWSNSAGQLSFFSLFFNVDERQPLYCSRLLKLLHLHEKLGPYYHAQRREITDYIKGHIFFMIKALPLDASRREIYTNHKNLLEYELSDEFRRCGINSPVSHLAQLGEGMEWDHSILVWHIATELCYYYDEDSSQEMPCDMKEAREAAKLLSRYMFYLLVRHPLMLQSADSKVKLKVACDEALRRFGFINEREEKEDHLTKSDVEKLIEMNVIESTPIVFYTCRLAKKLIDDDGEYKRNAWRLILRSWCAHLFHAAYNCREDYHVQQLRRGGELLTHVWMFMVHLGLTQQHFEPKNPRANSVVAATTRSDRSAPPTTKVRTREGGSNPLKRPKQNQLEDKISV